MEPVELTWIRVIRFWWAATWRGIVFTNVFFGAFAGISGVALLSLGQRELASTRWFSDTLLIALIPGFVFRTRSAIRAHYKDFRIYFIRPESKL